MPGVYISYPFCAQKCTYCNFASGVFPRELESQYLTALQSEIANARWQWTPETVYFGGGTPSQLDPAGLASLLKQIPGAPFAEATLEAAPGGLTLEKAQAWNAAGINRVSFGVQSFIKQELARTGRKHTAEIVQQEVAILHEAGIHNFNLDLIAGLPGQTAASWSESLHWIERLNPPHVSVYMLEVDEDSRLGSEVLSLGQRYGARDIPDDDQIADFYEQAVEHLARIGIPRYEISNFAREGHESRHNLTYWLREPYIGIGADAHSFDGRDRIQNTEQAADYVQSNTPQRTEADPISEKFFLGLRLTRGIPAPFTPFEPQVADLIKTGLLEISAARLRLTNRGVLLSNEVFTEFLTEQTPT
ncbi:MAG: radical SAM family heme chaperone HemW [Acidobacteriota bacterium]